MFNASISASASEFHLKDEKKNVYKKISPNKQQNKLMALVTTYTHSVLYIIHRNRMFFMFYARLFFMPFYVGFNSNSHINFN